MSTSLLVLQILGMPLVITTYDHLSYSSYSHGMHPLHVSLWYRAQTCHGVANVLLLSMQFQQWCICCWSIDCRVLPYHQWLKLIVGNTVSLHVMLTTHTASIIWVMGSKALTVQCTVETIYIVVVVVMCHSCKSCTITRCISCLWTTTEVTKLG